MKAFQSSFYRGRIVAQDYENTGNIRLRRTKKLPN